MLGMELVIYKYHLVLSTVQRDEYFCSTFIDEETEAGRSLLQVSDRAGADTGLLPGSKAFSLNHYAVKSRGHWCWHINSWLDYKGGLRPVRFQASLVWTTMQLDKTLTLANQISLRAKMQQRNHGKFYSRGMKSRLWGIIAPIITQLLLGQETRPPFTCTMLPFPF